MKELTDDELDAIIGSPIGNAIDLLSGKLSARGVLRDLMRRAVDAASPACAETVAGDIMPPIGTEIWYFAGRDRARGYVAGYFAYGAVSGVPDSHVRLNVHISSVPYGVPVNARSIQAVYLSEEHARIACAAIELGGTAPLPWKLRAGVVGANPGLAPKGPANQDVGS